MVGRAIYKLTRELGHDHITARNCALVWLLNPLPATVSSRGSAESVMAYLVLTALINLVQDRIITSAVYYALAVHFKIYPIIYALPVYLYLRGNKRNLQGQSEREIAIQDGWNIGKVISAMLPNKDRIVFIAVSGLVFGALTGFFYWK